MIKLADTLAPMSNDFYAVESKNVGINIDGTSKSIQQAYEDGDLSGGGSSIQVDTMPIASVDELGKIYEFIGSTGTYVNGYFYECVSDEQNPPTYSWVQKNVQPNSVTLTQEEYEALPEEQKLDGLYYTYDTKRIYKNGVQYGASDAEGIGYNNAESGIQATTVQGAIDKVVKTVEDNYAKTTDIPTTLPANGGNADTVNNHTVKSDVPENAVFTDTIYDDTEVKGSIEELSSNLGEKVDYKVVVEDGTRYVEDIVTQDINTWLPNDNSSILINLKKANGANYSNFQLLCNKQDSKNWTCIVIGGISTFWRICYVNGVRYIEELATMDKVNALHKETTGFITGSLLGSVVKNANLYYQKFGDNRLVINGWVSVDAVSARTPIFTLPNNWKANSNYLIPCYVVNSNVACACVIDIEKGTVNSYTPLPATSELRFCGEIYLM